MIKPEQYILKDDGKFPNSRLPVLHYKNVLHLPLLFAGLSVRKHFQRNGWGNNWRSGVYTYHHYHSICHEAMGVIKGSATLQLGGDHGIKLTISPGDVLIVPAGVAHRNLGDQDDVVCIGGYADGKDYDINCGKEGERPRVDRNIAAVPIPLTDPVTGYGTGAARIWLQYAA